MRFVKRPAAGLDEPGALPQARVVHRHSPVRGETTPPEEEDGSMKGIPRAVAVTAVAVAALLLPPAASTAQEADVIRLSVYQPAALPCGPQIVAEAKGYFEEER